MNVVINKDYKNKKKKTKLKMRNLEHTIREAGIIRHVIWIEYIEYVHHDICKYWYETINFGKGKENITGEVEHSSVELPKLVEKLIRKIK